MKSLRIDTSRKLNYSRGLALLVVILGMAFLYVPFREWWTAEYPPWSRLEIATVRVPLVLIAAAGSFVTLLLPPRFIYLYSAGVGLSAWVLTHAFYSSLGFAALVYPLLLLVGTQLVGWSSVSRALRVVLWVVVWVIASLLLGVLAAKLGETQAFKLFWIIHPAFAFLAGLQLVLFEDENERKSFPPASILSGISNYIFPLPVASDARYVKDQAELHSNWWLGAKSIVSSQILFLVLLGLVRWQHRTGAPPEWLMPLWLYVPFLLFVIASMTLVTGLQRAYGIVTRPAIGAVLRSTDPSEIWSRSSPHVVEFVMQRLYVPVVRRFRSPGLGLFVSLLFTMFQAAMFHSFLLRPLVATVFPAARQEENLGLVAVIGFIWVGFNWALLAFTHRLWRPWLKTTQSRLLHFLSGVLAHVAMMLAFWIPIRVLGPVMARLLGAD